MERKSYNSRTRRFRRWFFKKRKGYDPSHLRQISDGGEEDDDFSSESPEINPSTGTSELRVFVGTWNVAGRSPVGSLAVDLEEWLNLRDEADVYVLGFQEIVPLKAATVIGAEDPTEAMNWNLLIGKKLNDKHGYPWLMPMVHPVTNENDQCDVFVDLETPNSAKDQPKIKFEQQNQRSRYKLLASKKMVGVFISVWMRKELVKRYDVSGVKVCSVACGIMGYLGNKGSVSVSVSIGGTSFCFIAAHLASGEKKGDEGRRNYQVSEIFKRTSFPRLQEDRDQLHPLTILGHDHIFWFGDLNYRLYLEDNLARQLIRHQDWRSLQKFDQLQRELEHGGAFQGWKEGNIEFAPTYKYSSYNCNRYSGGIPSRAGEKQRTPAWCDRILWYGEGVRQLSYFRSESKFSDHRPVSALFSTKIEVKSNNISSPAFGTPGTTEIASEEATSTLLSLILKDEKASPTHMQTCISDRMVASITHLNYSPINGNCSHETTFTVIQSILGLCEHNTHSRKCIKYCLANLLRAFKGFSILLWAISMLNGIETPTCEYC